MSSPAGHAPRKVVLAYSGGLDTSCIIPWLKEEFGDCEVIAAAVDVGQPDDLSQIEAKALASGASRAYVVDARDEFLRDYVFPTLRRTKCRCKQPPPRSTRSTATSGTSRTRVVRSRTPGTNLPMTPTA